LCAPGAADPGGDLDRTYWQALGIAAGGARGIVAAIAATNGGPNYDGDCKTVLSAVTAGFPRFTSVIYYRQGNGKTTSDMAGVVCSGLMAASMKLPRLSVTV
jgi:hypothetical protein